MSPLFHTISSFWYATRVQLPLFHVQLAYNPVQLGVQPRYNPVQHSRLPQPKTLFPPPCFTYNPVQLSSLPKNVKPLQGIAPQGFVVLCFTWNIVETASLPNRALGGTAASVGLGRHWPLANDRPGRFAKRSRPTRPRRVFLTPRRETPQR